MGEFENRAVAPTRGPSTRRNRDILTSPLVRLPRVRRHPVGPVEPPVAAGEYVGTRVNSYAIDYQGFHCNRRVGDAVGSDEVYAITSVVSIRGDGTNVIRTEKHPIDQVEYGDVDLAETRLGPVARWHAVESLVSGKE